jgi:hypothetical protein
VLVSLAVQELENLTVQNIKPIVQSIASIPGFVKTILLLETTTEICLFDISLRVLVNVFCGSMAAGNAAK